MVPTIGRIVQVMLPNGNWRPAMVVNVFGDLVNARVFLDLANDLDPRCGGTSVEALVGINFYRCHLSGEVQVMSSAEGSEPGCWRWPPRD